MEQPEVERDTTKKVVTVYKDFPDPVKSVSAGMIAVPRYLFYTETDTKYVYQSRDMQSLFPVNLQSLNFTHQVNAMPFVYLPREQKYYEEQEGRLRLWVSGYQPQLDRYEWDDVTTTITETYKPPNKHWAVGLSGGYGMTIFDGKAISGPSAGFFGVYNFKRLGLGVSGELTTAAYNGGLLATPSVKAFAYFAW